MDIRKSTFDAPDDDELLTDKELIADQEARNGLLQFDAVSVLVQQYAPKRRIQITPEMICELGRIATQGVRRSAGMIRQGPISISNTPHVPPPADAVSEHMEAMCSYVRSRWNEETDMVETALHISAYLMWRLNWIHPFRDGNGRTSRVVSYLALSVGLGRELVGSPTIADQIVLNKGPYYRAIDEADEAWKSGRVDVTAMESLIEVLLEKQLSSA